MKLVDLFTVPRDNQGGSRAPLYVVPPGANEVFRKQRSDFGSRLACMVPWTGWSTSSWDCRDGIAVSDRTAQSAFSRRCRGLTHCRGILVGLGRKHASVLGFQLALPPALLHVLQSLKSAAELSS